MKRNEYVNAINHLQFGRDLATAVRVQANTKSRFRCVKAALIAAVLGCLMITTAFGSVSPVREHPADVQILGTDNQKLTDAAYMTFAVSEATDGVEKHYMELHHSRPYHFRHGMLWSGDGGYKTITEDFELAPVELEHAELTLEKNGRTYILELDYMDRGEEIISNHRSVYQKNEKGEILLNATDGSSNQWPVYFHAESRVIRDALPGWSETDFEGRCGGVTELMGGLLMTTIVNDGQSNSRNILYWIAPGAEEARVIKLPGKGLWHAENDTIYYQNDMGQLYSMDNNFSFRQICQYETYDYLQDGLLTVSVRGKLGILDAYTGELFVFDEIEASKDDTMDYHAVRYEKDGRIALAQTDWRHDPERIVLCRLGVLDKQSGKLNLLAIENDYDGYHYNWLDESRLAVIYNTGDRQILCIYEFKK